MTANQLLVDLALAGPAHETVGLVYARARRAVDTWELTSPPPPPDAWTLRPRAHVVGVTEDRRSAIDPLIARPPWRPSA